MNDYRAATSELQGQVLAAARKGQQRVAKSVRNVTTAAQQIRPQLASLPRPNLNISALANPASLREKAPELVAKLPPRLQAKLPSPEQLRASAHELAGHARSVRRMVAGQVRNVATPLAHQAVTRLSQVAAPARKPEPEPEPEARTTTRVSEVTVAKEEPAAERDTTAKASATGKAGAAGKTTSQGKASQAAKAKSTHQGTGTSRKPKSDQADT